MSIRHHVSDDLLLDYEAGTLAEGWGLAVATHLAYCPACRARAHDFAQVGGALLEAIDIAPLREGALNATLAQLDAVPSEKPIRRSASNSSVPAPLRDYIGDDLDDVTWKRIGTGAQAIIPTSDTATTVRLLRFPGGSPVPEHGHAGLELTVVLRGTLVDEDQEFGVGDIEIADAHTEHQPRAGAGSECICLAVTDAPLRFKSLLVRLAQPFLKI